jgi:hypothetical protein
MSWSSQYSGYNRSCGRAAPIRRRIAQMMMTFFLLLAIFGQANPSFRVIDRGVQSFVDDRREAVARTSEEFAALWKQHEADKPAPAVDFTRDIVVAVFIGSRPTGGFGVEIADVVTAPDRSITVRYRERRPAGDAITAQVITSPYVFAAVPRPTSADAPIRFERID